MKKFLALLMAMVMILAVASIASADEPIVVKYWHNRASGANQDALNAAMERFNSTIGAEKGIVAEATYIGGYPEIYAQVQLATQAGEQPAISVIGNTYVSQMIDDGLLANMAPYAEATGFDVNNLLDAFREIAGNTDGDLYSLPYIRSTPCFYYNKTMADELGIVIPAEPTIEDLVAACSKAYKVNEAGEVEVYGLEIYNDTGYYNAAWLWQLGEPMLSVEGDLESRTSPALDGTSMLKTMTDWYNWVQAGWCRPFDSTNASSIATEMMYQGKLFAVLQSSGSMKNIIKYMGEAGLEAGVAAFPTYDLNNKAVEIGGGQLVMIGEGNDEKTLAAAWELLQFLMSDNEVYENSMATGHHQVCCRVRQDEGILGCQSHLQGSLRSDAGSRCLPGVSCFHRPARVHRQLAGSLLSDGTGRFLDPRTGCSDDQGKQRSSAGQLIFITIFCGEARKGLPVQFIRLFTC